MGFQKVLYHELGLQHLISSRSSRDLYLLITSRFIRLLGSVHFLDVIAFVERLSDAPSSFPLPSLPPKHFLPTRATRLRQNIDSFGAIAPILVLFLQEQLGFSEGRVGLFLSLTLFGDVGLSLLISWIADGVGRRRVLAFGSAMMALSGVSFAFPLIPLSSMS